jgi:hypothetical protein
MRSLTTVIVATVTATLLAGGVTPAAAESEQTAAARAVAGRMLVAPRAEALVKRLPVRVAVRVPARTGRLWVRVGGRNVTARFRRSRGSLRVAKLTRGDGLRYGHNQLSVLAKRRGGRPVMQARSFVLARRQDGLVRLRVRPGPVTSLNVRVAGRASLAPGHFGKSGAVERRLSVIRRERTLRVWLNGRRVTRALDGSQPTRWWAKLSATHGLRYGVNRLRILIAEPDSGRYALLRRRFVVRRDRHLAGAGGDTATRVGGRARLDGRRSRLAHGGRPRHRWRIVSKPRGSRAKLRRAGSARPVLTPDRRGRYVVALTVTGRSKRATAAQATGSITDTVEVTAGPASLLVPFKGLSLTDRPGYPGIQVGDKFYPNPTPDPFATGYFMQWLTLDRRTLTPVKTGNTWFDGQGTGANGIQGLVCALSDPKDPCHGQMGIAPFGTDELVILSFVGLGTSQNARPPVQPAQIAAFNDAMRTLGVGPIDKGILQALDQKLAIVGVPSGDGSGRYTHGGRMSSDVLTGWLMPDALKDGDAFRFRFQPERPAFDTSSISTPTSNTMTLRDQEVDAALPPGYSGGFQIALIDPVDFVVVDQAVFGTNAPSLDPLSQRQAMVKFLQDNAFQYTIAVQSIGDVEPGGEVGVWRDLSRALAVYGANPHTFNTVGGSYAFLGGSWLEKDEVADSSSVVPIDPTANKRESGTLRGRMSMRRDGYWTPVAADPAESLDLSLYDTVFRPPTPWPYTAGGAFPQQQNCAAAGSDTAAYAAALSYIAAGIHLAADESDLRSAYVRRDESAWSDQKVDLLALDYRPGNGFGQAEFCNLKAQLQREFDWLDRTKTLFDTYKEVLGSSGNLQLVDLQQIGTKILNTIAIADTDAGVGWSLGGFVGHLISAGLAFVPGGEAVAAAWEALVAVYELVRELVSESGPTAKPVGDQVQTEVGELSHNVATQLAAAADALVRLRDVIISDYGRLQALGTQIEDDGSDVDAPTMTHNLRAAANAFFSSKLVPIPYGVHALMRVSPRGSWDDANTCHDVGLYQWRGVPDTARMMWMGDFDRDGQHGWFPTLFALGEHPLRTRTYPYPPKDMTDPMFTPTTEKVGNPPQYGYGMQLPRFMWEQFDKGFPPSQIFWCY